jgi:hypothetical protein
MDGCVTGALDHPQRFEVGVSWLTDPPSMLPDRLISRSFEATPSDDQSLGSTGSLSIARTPNTHSWTR